MRILLRLSLWCALNSGLDAYDLAKPLAPKGSLKLTLDYSLATTWPTELVPLTRQVNRNWVWSSHATFNGDVSQITDGQLWQLALNAFDEIETDMAQYDIRPLNRPSALSVLAWGKELIFATSQKGSTSFAYDYPDSPVRPILELCSVVATDDGVGSPNSRHRAEAKCAEPMALQLYYFSQDNNLSPESARIGSVVLGPGKAKPEARDPCAGPEKVSQNTSAAILFGRSADDNNIERIIGDVLYSWRSST